VCHYEHPKTGCSWDLTGEAKSESWRIKAELMPMRDPSDLYHPRHFHRDQDQCQPNSLHRARPYSRALPQPFSSHYVLDAAARKTLALALFSLLCGLLMAGISSVVADTIPHLAPVQISGATAQASPPPVTDTLKSRHTRTEAITSGMQVYLSPTTGRPIAADHMDRVSDIVSPIRAQTSANKSPLTVLTSTKEKGGKFIITGPHFRSHMQAGMIDDKAVALCTTTGYTKTGRAGHSTGTSLSLSGTTHSHHHTSTLHADMLPQGKPRQ